MPGLLSLLFLVAIGYGVYRVVKYVRYRNELARARDRVCDYCIRENKLTLNELARARDRVETAPVRRCCHCGAEMPDSAKFCGSCGHQIE